MKRFTTSSSLLNSPLVRRASTEDDQKWLTGERSGSGPTLKRSKSKRFVRKYQSSPDRAASWMRKRRLGAKSITLPGDICDLFSEAERAAINIIANVVKENVFCDWPIDKIAAIAGVCRRTVQNAVAKARSAKLITVQLRPVNGRKNLPNIIRIVCNTWLSWLKRVRSSFNLAIGCKTVHPTGEDRYTGVSFKPNPLVWPSNDSSLNCLTKKKWAYE